MASPTYTKSFEVFKKTILKQKVEVDIVWDNYLNYSTIGAALYVNDKRQFTVYGL